MIDPFGHEPLKTESRSPPLQNYFCERNRTLSHENVLLRFFQSNLKEGAPGKKTGERVVIEVVHPKDLAVTYETDLVRDRIKHEMSNGDRNVYKLGFLVDCYVEKSNGRPVLYRVTDIHEVFEIPDD